MQTAPAYSQQPTEANPPKGPVPPPYYQPGAQPPPYNAQPPPMQPQYYQQVQPYGYPAGPVVYSQQQSAVIVTTQPNGIFYGGALVVPGQGEPPRFVIPNPCCVIGAPLNLVGLSYYNSRVEI